MLERADAVVHHAEVRSIGLNGQSAFELATTSQLGTRMKKKSSGSSLERILKAAQAEFAKCGFNGARLDSIASDASVSKQLIYHYFKTKDELYEVVLDRVGQNVPHFLDDPEYDDLPPAMAIRLFVGHIIEANTKHPYVVKMTIDQSLHQGEHISNRSGYIPAVRKFIDERFTPIVQRGIKSKLFEADLDPYFLYWSIMAMASIVHTQNWDMTRTTGIDFSSKEGISKWQSYCTDFILRAIIPRDFDEIPEK